MVICLGTGRIKQTVVSVPGRYFVMNASCRYLLSCRVVPWTYPDTLLVCCYGEVAL